jgi:hypothetical protein
MGHLDNTQSLRRIWLIQPWLLLRDMAPRPWLCVIHRIKLRIWSGVKIWILTERAMQAQGIKLCGIPFWVLRNISLDYRAVCQCSSLLFGRDAYAFSYNRKHAGFDLKEWNISKDLTMDMSAWRLAINVSEPWPLFVLCRLCLFTCLPVSRLFWVSSLAYPNLLGTKGYVVVVGNMLGLMICLDFWTFRALATAK